MKRKYLLRNCITEDVVGILDWDGVGIDITSRQRENLTELMNLLRSGEIEERNVAFRMATFASYIESGGDGEGDDIGFGEINEHECGTSACMLGHAKLSNIGLKEFSLSKSNGELVLTWEHYVEEFCKYDSGWAKNNWQFRFLFGGGHNNCPKAGANRIECFLNCSELDKYSKIYSEQMSVCEVEIIEE